MRLEDNLAHYVRNVLRIKSGEQIRIFNEESGEFDAIVTTVSKKSVIIHVGEKVEKDKESSLHIHLGQALSRGERMDFVVQKSR